eukprot:4633002-Lingulodinium_polyedra.AAC.1
MPSRTAQHRVPQPEVAGEGRSFPPVVLAPDEVAPCSVCHPRQGDLGRRCRLSFYSERASARHEFPG